MPAAIAAARPISAIVIARFRFMFRIESRMSEFCQRFYQDLRNRFERRPRIPLLGGAGVGETVRHGGDTLTHPLPLPRGELRSCCVSPVYDFAENVRALRRTRHCARTLFSPAEKLPRPRCADFRKVIAILLDGSAEIEASYSKPIYRVNFEFSAQNIFFSRIKQLCPIPCFCSSITACSRGFPSTISP